MNTRAHRMPFGVELDAQGARFRLWAPSAKRVTLQAQSPSDGALQADLQEAGEGWFELSVAGFRPGAAYNYRIDGEIDVPDPASRFNPDGVHGRSRIIDPAGFDWVDADWRGRPWNEAVVYEMHVGCFTPQGSYTAAIERLDQLAELGVTAIELLPLAAFPGARGWGYDGVLLYAPHPAYGEPEDLKRFVQAAHARNLMVLLDVVYNHFGPEGNYLHRYAADFFTSRRKTPWGDAINFSRPTVRQFFIQNALYWVNEFHLDGLRIDAVHAMYDDSPLHFIDELVETVQRGPGAERLVHIVLENHNNEARRLVRPLAPGGLRQAQHGRQSAKQAQSSAGNPIAVSLSKGCVAQWNDDFHHVLHVLFTGEKDGYYADYADDVIARIGRVLTQGFDYQGETSKVSGHPRGEPSGRLPPYAFVSFLQNHDQIGNRALGERISHLAPHERLRAAYALWLLCPQIPMLFMGEEYAASQPFLYFCDYQGELADAVREGRRSEFAGFAGFADAQAREKIPDPNAVDTFERSRLDWSERERGAHAQQLTDVRRLLRVRAQHIAPCIGAMKPGAASFSTDGARLELTWPLVTNSRLLMIANLSDADGRPPAVEGELLYSTVEGAVAPGLAPWEMRLLRVRG